MRPVSGKRKIRTLLSEKLQRQERNAVSVPDVERGGRQKPQASVGGLHAGIHRTGIDADGDAGTEPDEKTVLFRGIR